MVNRPQVTALLLYIVYIPLYIRKTHLSLGDESLKNKSNDKLLEGYQLVQQIWPQYLTRGHVSSNELFWYAE